MYSSKHASQAARNDLAIVAKYRRQSGPLNFDGIFQELGLRYTERPLAHNCGGRIDPVRRGFAITTNSDIGPQSRRFAAAHLLAHFLLHRDLLTHGHVDGVAGRGRDGISPYPLTESQDRQADMLAIELLLPERRLRGKSMAEADALAREYMVSTNAMHIRLRGLTAVPYEKAISSSRVRAEASRRIME